jgi:hypothetical protein
LQSFEICDLAVSEIFGHDEEAFVDVDLWGGHSEGVDPMLFEAIAKGQF